MATAHYNFPTITGTDTIDGVNAINGLANSVDAALFGVAGSIPEGYTLPIAGTTSLGGVRGAGQIAVNPSTGDMTINNGTINGAMIQTGAIMGSNLATGAVASNNLSSSVQAQINEGVNANAAISAAPKLYHFGNAPTGGNLVSGLVTGTMTVNDAAGIIVLKAYMSDAVFKLPSTNTNVENPLVKIGTVPAQYRPTNTTFDVYMVGTNDVSGDNGMCMFYAGVASDGTFGIYHTNYSATYGGRNVGGYWASSNVVYYYGAQDMGSVS